MYLLTLLTVVCLSILSNTASPLNQNHEGLDKGLVCAYLSIDDTKEIRVASSKKIFFKMRLENLEHTKLFMAKFLVPF